jgi:hypothetical protein
VHGLTGGFSSTWTDKKTNTLWPKTLLSKDIPNARILALGYDADVVNFWVPASQNRVREHAVNFNNALCDLRDATRTVSTSVFKALMSCTYWRVNLDRPPYHPGST